MLLKWLCVTAVGRLKNIHFHTSSDNDVIIGVCLSVTLGRLVLLCANGEVRSVRDALN